MARCVLCVLWCCFFFVLIYTSVHGVPKHPYSVYCENLLKVLSEMNNDFAFRLYKSIVSGAQSQNLFFSPLSVSTALAALSLGAVGETHQQLLTGLGFNSSLFTSEEMYQAFLDLLQNLNQRTGVELNMGSAVYFNNSFKPRPEFLEDLKRFCLSEGFSVDFKKTSETSDQINNYVSEKTHGKIRKFIENLDARTIMYLLSYIYFKGKWLSFHPNTRADQFHVDEKTTVPVQMMYTNGGCIYYDRQLSVQVVRLNYYIDSFSVILALPYTNITILEEGLRPHHITKWQKWMSEREINIFFPKLSLNTSYSLNSVLSEMGFMDMFTAKANFSRISDENLLVSEAVHKANLDIDVDEAGATATAVIGIGFKRYPRRYYSTIKFDRPFMIFIVDQKTNNILCMGKIVNPSNSDVHQ